MSQVFVFGSNLAGRHGKGAAEEAKRRHGAINGQGRGRQGSSYAIPTKGYKMESLTLALIRAEVEEFLNHARDNPNDRFMLTPIGCGLAGYLPSDIAPLFATAPKNVILPEEFKRVLEGNSP